MPIATGENLFSVQDARNLSGMAACGPTTTGSSPTRRSRYGLTDICASWTWPRRRLVARRCVPHGGHQLGLNMAAGLQLGGTESYPGVFQPYGGFADDLPVVDGYVRLPEEPGIGMELKRTMFAAMRKHLGFE